MPTLYASYAPIFVMPARRSAVSMIWITAEDAQKLAISVQKNVRVWLQRDGV
jgi:hypothetical protein